ncbi:homeobox protein ceh-30-like [Saccostrea cucullata]|uniref:homeobox protein ceh-30-like n=1 Tax=Saccostrea cuccullata TaxID=36930 RepID=UPI002ED0924A
MLSESKPKRASFSIEFLARSSHDEEKEEVKVQQFVSPKIVSDVVFQPIKRSDLIGSPFLTPERFTNTKTVSPHTMGNGYPLKLPLISPTNSSVKRKREDSCDSGVESPSPDRFRHISEASNSSSNCSYISDLDDSDDLHKRKKARTAFSTEQINDLEKRYQFQKYLPANERQALAEKLGLSDQQVKTWFQNRRMKEKRQKRDDEHARTFSLPTGGVDVSQLTALGLPCPPPYNMSATNFAQLPGFTHHSPQYPMTSSPGHFPAVLPHHASFPVSPAYLQRQSYPHPVPYMSLSPNLPSPKLGQIPRGQEKSGV